MPKVTWKNQETVGRCSSRRLSDHFSEMYSTEFGQMKRGHLIQGWWKEKACSKPTAWREHKTSHNLMNFPLVQEWTAWSKRKGKAVWPNDFYHYCFKIWTFILFFNFEILTASKGASNWSELDIVLELIMPRHKDYDSEQIATSSFCLWRWFFLS